MQQKAMGIRGRRSAAGSIMAIALAASLMVPLPALADPTSGEKQAEAQAALASLNSMQETLDKASADYGTALAEQQEAETNRDAAQQRIDEVSAQISELQGRLGSRATSMYRTGSTSFLDLLLGSSSFKEFSTNWDMLNSINENDAEMVQQTKDLKSEAEQEKAVYVEQERIASDKANEAKRLQDEAAATVSIMQATYDNLSAEAAELLAQEQAAQEAAEAAAAQAVVDASSDQADDPDPVTPSGGGGGTSNSGGGSAPTYNPATGNAVVDRAYSQIGKPYVWGATGPDSFDCSGLVGYALTGGYGRVGTTYTYMAWPMASDPQPGDICTSSYHCGIYIGGGQMIHAPQRNETVKVGPVQGDMIIVRCPW